MGIDKTHSTSMRPQANGLVERFNRTLVSILKAFCENNQNAWDIYLQQSVMAYRSFPQNSTKISPNKMVCGREITLPLQAFTSRPAAFSDEQHVEDYVFDLQDQLKACHEIARKNIKAAATYQKRHYDVGSKRKSYATGQLVWLHDPTRKVGICTKLKNKWKGPYLISRRVDDLVYMVKQTACGKAKAYHVDRIQPYKGTKLPRWIQREKMEICNV